MQLSFFSLKKRELIVSIHAHLDDAMNGLHIAERCPSGRRSTLGKRVYGNVPRVRIPPSPPFLIVLQFDSRVLHNKGSRTPPGPEGSNGSDFLYVLQGARLSFFLLKVFL